MVLEECESNQKRFCCYLKENVDSLYLLPGGLSSKVKTVTIGFLNCGNSQEIGISLAELMCCA